MQRKLLIIYLVIVFILSFVIVEDIYQVLFYGDSYPFGKEDLGFSYKSKTHYLLLSFAFVGWLLSIYILKKLNKVKLMVIHAVITFSYLIVKIIILSI